MADHNQAHHNQAHHNVVTPPPDRSEQSSGLAAYESVFESTASWERDPIRFRGSVSLLVSDRQVLNVLSERDSPNLTERRD